jgi:hypothetical protein
MNLRNIKTATTVRPNRRAISLLALSLTAVLGITANGCFTSPSRDVLSSGSFSELPSATTEGFAGARYVTFNVPSAGTVDARVDWSASANDVDAELLDGACSPTIDCASLAVSTGSSKPIRLSYAAIAGRMTVLIVNWGPGRESGSWEVVFTPAK